MGVTIQHNCAEAIPPFLASTGDRHTGKQGRRFPPPSIAPLSFPSTPLLRPFPLCSIECAPSRPRVVVYSPDAFPCFLCQFFFFFLRICFFVPSFLFLDIFFFFTTALILKQQEEHRTSRNRNLLSMSSFWKTLLLVLALSVAYCSAEVSVDIVYQSEFGEGEFGYYHVVANFTDGLQVSPPNATVTGIASDSYDLCSTEISNQLPQSTIIVGSIRLSCEEGTASVHVGITFTSLKVGKPDGTKSIVIDFQKKCVASPKASPIPKSLFAASHSTPTWVSFDNDDVSLSKCERNTRIGGSEFSVFEFIHLDSLHASNIKSVETKYEVEYNTLLADAASFNGSVTYVSS